MNYVTEMKATTIHGHTTAPEVEEGQEPLPCDCTVVLTQGGDKVELTINDYAVATAFAEAMEADKPVQISFTI